MLRVLIHDDTNFNFSPLPRLYCCGRGGELENTLSVTLPVT
jgi:hypothetical protein